MRYRSDINVQLIDHMGTDDSIVRAARASTGNDQITLQKKEGLINYLVREKHTSPLEACVVTVRVEAPIFVAREWLRHRTQCLSGDSIISFSRPDNGKHYPYKLKRLYKNWNDPSQIGKIKNMQLRTINENTGEVVLAKVSNVIYSGEKEVFRLTLENGFHVDGTLRHKVFTVEGWREIGDLIARPIDVLSYAHRNYVGHVPQVEITTPDTEWRDIKGYEGQYQVSDAGNVRSLLNQKRNPRETPLMKKRFVGATGYLTVGLSKHGSDEPANVHRLVAEAFLGEVPRGFEVCHKDGNKLNPTLSNLKIGTSKDNSGDMKSVGTRKVPKAVPSPIKSITRIGVQDTYDISVEGEYPNFLANNIVVHNSYSELSMRFAEAEPEFYMPSYDRPIINEGSGAHPKLAHSSRALLESARVRHEYAYETAWQAYTEMLRSGVATEVARNVLPVGVYTTFYATANLNNWFKFLDLRDGTYGAPQYEIVEGAKQVGTILEGLFPVTCGAWRKHR